MEDGRLVVAGVPVEGHPHRVRLAPDLVDGERRLVGRAPVIAVLLGADQREGAPIAGQAHGHGTELGLQRADVAGHDDLVVSDAVADESTVHVPTVHVDRRGGVDALAVDADDGLVVDVAPGQVHDLALAGDHEVRSEGRGLGVDERGQVHAPDARGRCVVVGPTEVQEPVVGGESPDGSVDGTGRE